MKIIDCEQRSPEWYEARLGIPTASSIWKIVTQSGKKRAGKTPETYMNALLAERLTRKPSLVAKTAAMERGAEMESLARNWYEQSYNAKVKQVGFALDDSLQFGCSPDGIMEYAGLEIKCPLIQNFMEVATTQELPEAHYVQVQTCMMIFEIEKWEYVSFTDQRGLYPVVIHCEIDKEFTQKLTFALDEFCDELDRREAVMRKHGNGVPIDTPIDLSDLEANLSEMECVEASEI